MPRVNLGSNQDHRILPDNLPDFASPYVLQLYEYNMSLYHECTGVVSGFGVHADDGLNPKQEAEAYEARTNLCVKVSMMTSLYRSKPVHVRRIEKEKGAFPRFMHKALSFQSFRCCD